MRKKIIQQFAAGTCSVCLVYALTTQAFSDTAISDESSFPLLQATTATVQEGTASADGRSWKENRGEDSLQDGYGHGGKHGKGSTEDASWSADTEEIQTVVAPTENASGEPPTLAQFLSSLRCGGCRHNCFLVSPRCMKGRSKAQTATVQYNEQYGV